MKITIKQLLLLSFGVFILLLSFMQGADVGFTIIIILWYYSLVYCLFDIKKRLGYACFLATFFLFLLGAYVADQFFHYTENVVFFDKSITTHIYILLAISLLGLFLGNIIDIRKKYKNGFKDNKLYLQHMKRISKIGFYISFIPYLISVIIQAALVRNSGYTEIYLSDTLLLPFIIRIIAYSCPIFLFLFLSTLPNKRECNIPIFLYFIYSAISLLSGRRSIFVINCLTIFMYILYRSSNGKEEKWINKKILLTLFIILPIVAILLNVYGQTRFGDSDVIKHNNIFDSILNVFTSQGVSISVIGYEKYYENVLPDKLYSLSGLIEFLKFNPVSNVIFNFTKYTGQTVERALYGDLFTHAISYFVLPYNYLRGRGLGSSYIAEVYHDFSYIGVFIVNLIYGVVLKVCSNFNRNSVWLRFICLMIINSILMAPRSTTDAFISNFTHIEVILAVILVWGGSNILYNRKRLNRKINE